MATAPTADGSPTVISLNGITPTVREVTPREHDAAASAGVIPTPLTHPSAASNRRMRPIPPPLGGLEVQYTLLTMDPHSRTFVHPSSGIRTPVRLPLRALVRHRQPRVKLVIVITAYNEGWGEISSTLRGVMDNLSCLHSITQGSSHMPMGSQLNLFSSMTDVHGAAEAAMSLTPVDPTLDACRSLRPAEVVVLLVFDGREKVAGDMFGSFAQSGCILTPSDRARMAEAVAAAPARPADSDDRDCHLFECEYRADVARGVPYPVAANLILAVKDRNGGKLNSHVWALKGLCPFLRPRYVVLLDAGTVAAPTAILKLYRDMEEDASIGGCCGEILVDAGQRSVMAPVIMAQHFEYTTANAVDKAFESVMGYIGVLPGAFSAYRWEAIQGAPLAAYFKLEEKDATSGLSPSTANMYLAEDRILGFEICAKAGCHWRLHYDAGAQAATDVPDTVGKLVRQRRRWLNGSFFAGLYAIQAWHRLLGGTRHNLIRKLLFIFLFFYQIINILLAWFSIGNAYVAARLVYDNLGSSSLTGVSEGSGGAAGGAACPGTHGTVGITNLAFAAAVWIYELLHAALFVWSLGNRPDESERLWSVVAHTLGMFNTVSIIIVLWQSPGFSAPVLFTGIGALSVYAFCAILQGKLIQLALSVLHYLYCLPLFVLLIPIYAQCNTHDISWGNRPGGSHAASADVAAMDRRFREFRSTTLMLWLASNWIFVNALDQLGRAQFGSTTAGLTAMQWYAAVVAGLAGMSLGVRALGCILYVLQEWFKRTMCLPRSVRNCCRVPALPYTASAPGETFYMPRAAVTGGRQGSAGKRKQTLRANSGLMAMAAAHTTPGPPTVHVELAQHAPTTAAASGRAHPMSLMEYMSRAGKKA